MPKNLIHLFYLYTKKTPHIVMFLDWWAGMDSNHRRRSRRIYSPLHLAALQPTHKF